ncbi:hypothetical protein CesoFtcFv8_023460 [Champsocephalus esox]|uniref:Uncharacterized protein n=2 Tax=Champsocephalus TaxID=52236 RepID=A0AAN8H638_CHAGU|nr:hypothetical protein CesoFtcFv8_023460 [Champsocephalus esox]KAK5903891.1 hypothetical protein CgunFtcFv8_007636 [Champsocephalus gunnari]
MRNYLHREKSARWKHRLRSVVTSGCHRRFQLLTSLITKTEQSAAMKKKSHGSHTQIHRLVYSPQTKHTERLATKAAVTGNPAPAEVHVGQPTLLLQGVEHKKTMTLRKIR